jgi:hypothetical protein
MSAIRQAVEEYVAVRRSLGFELRLPAAALRRFAAFMEAEGATFVTAQLALSWATLPARAQPATWAGRLAVVRRFAAWHRASDPRTEVPSAELLPHRYRRKPPYVYSDEEIREIVRAAAALPSAQGLRALTYATLFGLLAVSGMRVSEALALDLGDVDLEQGMLTIRRTKSASPGSCRCILPPLPPSAATCRRESACFPGRQPRASSSRSGGARGSLSGAPVTPLPSSARRAVCGKQQTATAAAPGCTTCVTDSPSAR